MSKPRQLTAWILALFLILACVPMQCELLLAEESEPHMAGENRDIEPEDPYEDWENLSEEELARLSEGIMLLGGSSGSDTGSGGGGGDAASSGASNMISVGVTMQVVYYRYDQCYNRHMTVDISETGLAEINGDQDNANGALYRGYSNYTLRVTYSARVNADASLTTGQNGNDNQVVLTWKRSSDAYYDTLISDAHVYFFGMDLSKVFSKSDPAAADEAGLYNHVKFKLKNATDNVWITAMRSGEDGVYYVTGSSAVETDATILYPTTVKGLPGKIVVQGLEDDEYILTEIETANGYTLLRDSIRLKITTQEDPSRPCTRYEDDLLGVLQNDPHYSFDGGYDLHLAGIPQTEQVYNLLTASATVDGNAVTMLADGESTNAAVPLKIVNTQGFDLPDTGDTGTVAITVVGITLMAGSAVFFVLAARRRKTEEE